MTMEEVKVEKDVKETTKTPEPKRRRKTRTPRRVAPEPATEEAKVGNVYFNWTQFTEGFEDQQWQQILSMIKNRHDFVTVFDLLRNEGNDNFGKLLTLAVLTADATEQSRISKALTWSTFGKYCQETLQKIRLQHRMVKAESDKLQKKH